MRELLERLKELESKATKGPWKSWNLHSTNERLDDLTVVQVENGLPEEHELNDNWIIAKFYGPDRKVNGVLLQELRNALPSLIKAIEDKDREIERLRQDWLLESKETTSAETWAKIAARFRHKHTKLEKVLKVAVETLEKIAKEPPMPASAQLSLDTRIDLAEQALTELRGILGGNNGME